MRNHVRTGTFPPIEGSETDYSIHRWVNAGGKKYTIECILIYLHSFANVKLKIIFVFH